MEKIAELRAILADNKKLLGVIKEEILIIATKFGDERRTSIGIDLDDDVTYGAVVADISKGSSADKADLQKGDVIIKINDYKVENYMYLKYYLYRFNVGDKVTLTYLRDGKEKTAEITLKN